MKVCGILDDFFFRLFIFVVHTASHTFQFKVREFFFSRIYFAIVFRSVLFSDRTSYYRCRLLLLLLLMLLLLPFGMMLLLLLFREMQTTNCFIFLLSPITYTFNECYIQPSPNKQIREIKTRLSVYIKWTMHKYALCALAKWILRDHFFFVRWIETEVKHTNTHTHKHSARIFRFSWNFFFYSLLFSCVIMLLLLFFVHFFSSISLDNLWAIENYSASLVEKNGLCNIFGYLQNNIHFPIKRDIEFQYIVHFWHFHSNTYT